MVDSRRPFRASAAIFSALILASCGVSAAPAGGERRVIDGDTLDLGGERVRLINIDAPEMPPKSKCWAEAALAEQATEAARQMVNAADRIALERHGVDRYGRTLAYVALDGHDLGEAMVSGGFAARWIGRRWDWCGAPDLSDESGPDLGAAWGGRRFMGWLSRHH